MKFPKTIHVGFFCMFCQKSMQYYNMHLSRKGIYFIGIRVRKVPLALYNLSQEATKGSGSLEKY